MPKRRASQEIRVALDIMSGDESPRSRMHSVLRLLKDKPELYLYLVGDGSFINTFLADFSDTDFQRISVIHTAMTVDMNDRPSQVLRSKKDSSMWKILEITASGQADACVSAGNTGALMVMGRHLLKTFSGVDRPAIAASMHRQNKSVIFLDIGANVDSTAEHLQQFAIMGSQLASCALRISKPKVALLNIGTEDNKGNEQVRRAHQLLQENKQLNYTGYIEGHSTFSGIADVIVCDGFTGNIALKTAEGIANLVQKELHATFYYSSWWKKLLGFSVSSALTEFDRRVSSILPNGATFLGLQGIVVKSHGSANEQGFYQAVCQAIREVESGLSDCLAAGIEDSLKASR